MVSFIHVVNSVVVLYRQCLKTTEHGLHNHTSLVVIVVHFLDPALADRRRDTPEMHPDACPLGGGCLWGSIRLRFLWSSRERRYYINVLEAETILRMLRADASSLDHCKLSIWCDNMVTVKGSAQGDKQITPPH